MQCKDYQSELSRPAHTHTHTHTHTRHTHKSYRALHEFMCVNDESTNGGSGVGVSLFTYKFWSLCLSDPPADASHLCCLTHSAHTQKHTSAGDLYRKTGTSEIREHSKLILFDLFSEDMSWLLWTVDKKTNFPWAGNMLTQADRASERCVRLIFHVKRAFLWYL